MASQALSTPIRQRLKKRLVDKRKGKIDTTGKSVYLYQGKRITETYAKELVSQGKRLDGRVEYGKLEIKAETRQCAIKMKVIRIHVVDA